jgi:transcriptional regulator with XRE-family HTH domain
MSSFKEFLEEQLQDEEFAEAYEQVSGEMDFAVALAQRREELGLTQQRLAQLTGIKQPMIARIENGQMPTAPTLQKLALGLKVGIVFTGVGILLTPYAGRAKPKDEATDHAGYQKASASEFTYKFEESTRYRMTPEKEYSE